MTATSVVARVRVTAIQQLSPCFTRVELGAPELADLGVDGPLYDQRIKLLFPSPGLPTLGDGNWYAAWRGLPEAERGHMRTYSVRDVRGSGEGTRIVVDFVLHLTAGSSGPASEWAARARPGDELILVGPRRGASSGGIEFAPGGARTLLLAGDETAVPAIGRILADLGPEAQGDAFLEVPTAADELPLVAPAGVAVHWLARDGAMHGARLVGELTDQLGHGPVPLPDTDDPDIWETPTYSSSGETLVAAAETDDLYVWIAGEAAMVTALRRFLVSDLGTPRSHVAFMGYWRKGKAALG